MKSYKELQENLQKVTEGQETVGGAGRSAHSDFGVHRVEHPEQLGRLNAFLNAFTQMEFLEPKSAIATIRHKLNLAGMDFEWNNTSTYTPEENLKLPLNRYGGSFGTTPTHDLKQGFYKGDNIAEFNGGVGLSLSIDVYQEDSGLYQMDAKIIPNVPE
tara:strand:+ start:2382 stop:2855 length:474 start_codon:yes stop_codon:yes gene_type:complete